MLLMEIISAFEIIFVKSQQEIFTKLPFHDNFYRDFFSWFWTNLESFQMLEAVSHLHGGIVNEIK